MSKVLFVLTSHDELGDSGRATGWYVPEAAHPWRALRDAGHEVELASIDGGSPRPDGVDGDDPVVGEFLRAMGPRIQTTRAVSDLDPADYDAVLFVGGHGAMWDFPANADLQRITRDLWESGKVVAAVCHGPAALVDVPLADGTQLVAGRDVSAFTDDEERAVKLEGVVPFLLAQRLAQQGATHTQAAAFAEHVIVDGRLVTGQNPASAGAVGARMVELLGRAREARASAA